MSQNQDLPTGREDARNCFVCGPDNASGLQVRFHLEENVCHGEFTPAANHCGYDGITHGGILFSLLDDVMANWLFLRGLRGYTAKCEIRFRNPLPIGCRLLLEGWSVKQKRSLVRMEGIAKRADTDQPIAQCQASFFIER